MMRGGRGRNRGRGRGDMGMDDDHHGDMDNGVHFHTSGPVRAKHMGLLHP